MNSLWIHPAVIFFIGAALLQFIPERFRKNWLLFIPILAFMRIVTMPSGTFGQMQFLDWTLTFGRVDRLSLIFSHIMGLIALIGTLYGLHVKRSGEHIAAWMYVGGSLGAIYAGDLLTLFLFWELMAISSVFLIWFRERPKSLWVGYRYLLVHMAGGVILLMGILLHYHEIKSLEFVAFNVQQPTLATYMVMIGFILNAAVPPLHAWLPDAYSEATFNGSVFMSSFTTKTAVYALCRGLPGLEILVPLGVIMALYGVVYAVIENDSRRLLGYHIISQVGYMVAAVGLADLNTSFGQLALNGACAHAFAHILYKALLFMGCGSVLHMTGESRFTHLGGLYKRMPWTFLFTFIGGLSISAFPFFSGFVSKSMIVAAGFESHKAWVGFGLMLASVGTFSSVGLKVPYLIWFGKNKCSKETWNRATEPGWNMLAAMAITSVLCIFIGSYTPYLYDMLPFPLVEYHPYTSYHIAETMQILLFTALGFFFFLRKIKPEQTISLDTDLFYRMGGRTFLWFAEKRIQSADNVVGQIYQIGGVIPLKLSAAYVKLFDNRIIDRFVDKIAKSVLNMGNHLRILQRGLLQENLIVAVSSIALGLFLLIHHSGEAEEQKIIYPVIQQRCEKETVAIEDIDTLTPTPCNNNSITGNSKDG
jgi:multicomponent Na+:H+ antiporter subunit D